MTARESATFNLICSKRKLREHLEQLELAPIAHEPKSFTVCDIPLHEKEKFVFSELERYFQVLAPRLKDGEEGTYRASRFFCDGFNEGVEWVRASLADEETFKKLTRKPNGDLDRESSGSMLYKDEGEVELKLDVEPDTDWPGSPLENWCIICGRKGEDPSRVKAPG